MSAPSASLENTLANELAELHQAADLDALPRHCGASLASGILRAAPEDFSVIENLGFQPCDSGEHLYVRLRKVGQNTRWLAKELGKFAGIPYKSVSYAGLKDRHAVTEQTFSLHMPGMADPDWSALSLENVTILSAGRHDRKLRQGQLSYNRFRILVRSGAVDNASVFRERVARIAAEGVPNYFGAQRFGRAGGNLDLIVQQPRLRKLPREQRSFALSALRSAMFNGYLAARVTDGSWQQALEGEALLSDRPRGVAEDDESMFPPERIPAAVLWGKSFAGTGGAVREREQAWFERFPTVCAALESAGCRMSRRVMRARVGQLEYGYRDGIHDISFNVGPGIFATVVLRELFRLEDAALTSGETND